MTAPRNPAGIDGPATPLHDTRIAYVVDTLLAARAESVLDLGCGGGDLLLRLAAHACFRRILGIDISLAALEMARQALALDPFEAPGRVQVRQASFTDADTALQGYDAAVLLETLEHVDPGRLSRVERAVFGSFRPRTVLVTTPNREYNAVYGIPPGRLRHPDHRFEWDRDRFGQWAGGVAARNGYEVAFHAIGDAHPTRGASTQMAAFTRAG